LGARPKSLENLYGCGFTCSVGAEQAKDFAFCDIESDTAHGFEIAIGLMQACYVDDGLHVCWNPFYRPGRRSFRKIGERRETQDERQRL